MIYFICSFILFKKINNSKKKKKMTIEMAFYPETVNGYFVRYMYICY